MKFVTFTGVVFTLMLAFVANSIAAELTLDDCIALALKNRASIIQARNAEDLAKVSQRAALGAFLPKVAASYDWNKREFTDNKTDIYNDSTKIEREDVSFADFHDEKSGLEAGAVLSFALPGHWFNYLTSRAVRESSRLDVISSEQDLILTVKRAFYLYLAAVQNVGVQEDAVKRSEEQLKLIQSKFELGSAAKSDVLKQKVQYGNDKLLLLQARNDVISGSASLAYVVGLDPMAPNDFSTNYAMRKYDGTLQDAVQYGLTHKPGLLAAEQDIRAANYGVKSAWSEYAPNVSPSVSYGYGMSTANSAPYYRSITSSGNTFSYGINLSWNIFDGFGREKRLKSATVYRNNAKALLADNRNLTVSGIKAAYLAIDQLREQQNVAKDNVDAATEDLKITQEKYNLGAATILDLLNAQVSLRQAQFSQINADYEMNKAVANLENAMGKM